MLKVIGGEQEGEFKAVASGTLPNGKPVVVNADGTVSVASSTTFTEALGSSSIWESATVQNWQSDFDTINKKLLIVYGDDGNSNYGTAVVGTVNTSDNSISFGTPVVFNSADTGENGVAFSSDIGKFLVVYEDSGTTGKAIVATVSGTTVSFGSATTFSSINVRDTRVVYNEASGGDSFFVVAYRQDDAFDSGRAVVISILANGSPNVYSPATFNGAETSQISLAYDSVNQKTVIAYKDDANSNRGTAVVATRSTGTLTFGSEIVFETGLTQYTATVYDSTNNKIVIAYQDFDNTTGAAIVGTVSGTSISFGTKVTFNAGNTLRLTADFDADAGKVVIGYADGGNSNYGTYVVGTVSGTSISFGSEVVFESANVNSFDVVTRYCSTIGKVVFAYRNITSTNYGYAIVLQNAYTFNNLTAENYIGMSRGVVNSVDAVTGTESVFDSTTAGILDSVSVYDPDTQKTIIAYADRDNNDAVTAAVATVTGTTFSFGTPVVADSGADAEDLGIAYDSTNDRVIITYTDTPQTTGYGTAVVGQVSGTSITFGTPVVYESALSYYNAVDFDANSGKVVIAYMDSGNNNYGTAIVGTVSGNSISFGTPVVFNSGTSQYMSTVYDPSSQKTVIAYRDSGTLNRGEAIVGTVSGTSISFGSVTLFDSTSGHEADNISAAYDPDTQQVIVAYREDGASTGFKTHGRAVVGSVSGTSITFGDPASFNAVSTQYIAAGYDTVANKAVIAYRDRSNSDYGTIVAGTVEGTSLTFETPTVYSGTDAVIYIGASFNESAGSFVISYRDMTSLDGTAVAYQASYIQRYPVADGDRASLDIIGSVSENQLSLTAGEKYYVQTDGTISTTAGSPSVLAGTAISATKLVVKT